MCKLRGVRGERPPVRPLKNRMPVDPKALYQVIVQEEMAENGGDATAAAAAALKQLRA